MTEDEMVEWHHQLNGHEFELKASLMMDREAWSATIHVVMKNQTRLREELTDSVQKPCHSPCVIYAHHNMLWQPSLGLF